MGRHRGVKENLRVYILFISGRELLIVSVL